MRSGANQSHDEKKKADEIIHKFTRDNQLTGTRKSRHLSPFSFHTHSPLAMSRAIGSLFAAHRLWHRQESLFGTSGFAAGSEFMGASFES